MKVKKIIGILFLILLSALIFSVQSGAKSYADDVKEIYGALDPGTQELLKDIGVDSADFDSMFSVTPQRVRELTKKLVTGSIEAPTRSAGRLISVVILIAIFECFAPDDVRMKNIVGIVGTLMCVISVISPLSTAVSSAVSSISVSEKLMLALIPVLAAVITVTGNPTLAASFQSIAFTGAQIISGMSNGYIVPIVGAVMALDITGSVMPSFRLGGITALIKKTVTAVLTFVSTLFVSFLGIKGALANAADTVASKGIKLVISSAVPVVGGALSEAYSGIIGSLVLVKSTIGIFGIAAIALINLPSCIQLLFWIFALKFSAAVGELFNQQGISDLLKALASSLTLLNVVLLFNAVLFIISTALILVIKAG